jgi:hypothetical protein
VIATVTREAAIAAISAVATCVAAHAQITMPDFVAMR